MIDILFEHYEDVKDKNLKFSRMNFFKKTFNYVLSAAIGGGKTSKIDYKNCSIVDSSIISFLVSSFYDSNFKGKININFVVNDFFNFENSVKYNRLDFVVQDTNKYTYKYVNYALNEVDIPEDFFNKEKEVKINCQLSLQDIFYDYSRYLNDDLLCDYKRTIALFYTFNAIFESKSKIEYNYDNLFYYIFGFFDYKYVLMIKHKLEYIKNNKTELNDYVKEIDLRVSTGLFSSLQISNKRFQNTLKFKNKYKMVDNEIIYNLMNFEEFFNNNKWGISIGFYESLKFLTFIKEDWNDTSISDKDLEEKISNWYKDILEISDFIKTKFKIPQVMQYSSYIFD